MFRKHYYTITVGPSSEEEQYNFLVIGKTGNGKSSLWNAILGREQFETGNSMVSTTETAQYADVIIQGVKIRVVDTPDPKNCNMSETQMQEEVTKWRSMATSKPSLVLLAVRCDVRYTAEEYALYRQMLRLWGDNSLRQRLVVAFTFGDRQDRDIKEELRTVCPELKSVLRDAGQRYVVFNKQNTDSVRGLVHELLGLVTTMRRQEKEGWGAVSCSNPVFLGMVVVVVMAVVGCVVFASLGITVGAIVTGVIGLLVIIALVAIVVISRNNRVLV